MTLNRRQFTQAAAALAAGGAAPLVFAADTLKIGYVSPQTGPLAPFGEADKWVIEQMKTAFKDGISVGGKKYAVQIVLKDSQSNPEPRGRGRQRPDPQGQGRAGADRRHARDRQPGERCLRAQRGALRLQRGAVAALVLRPQGRSGQGLQLDLPPVLGAGGRHRQLHQRLEDGRDQQEGRRPVPQRRRRQCLGRQGARLPEAAGADGLHAHRPGPLPERHAGLQRADRRVQARQRRDRHRRGDPARCQDLPDAGAAAGLQAEGHHARQGAAVPGRDRGAGRAGRRPVDRGVVEPFASRSRRA